MPDSFVPRPLTAAQIDQAFPVIQTAMPDLNMDKWRSFASQKMVPGVNHSGIMTVQSRGYIHGLFSYTVKTDLRHERILAVDNFLVVDLFNPSGAAKALMRAIEHLAGDQECSSVQASLPANQPSSTDYRCWLLDQMREQGYQIETMLLGKGCGAMSHIAPSLSPMPRDVVGNAE